MMKLHLIDRIRTNNFHDENIMEKIQTLWRTAYRKLNNNEVCVYGVYYDYESDYKGDYSLGVAIEEVNKEPFIELPQNAKYEVFKVDPTDEQGIIQAWRNIWELEETGSLKRAYTYDFEKYYPNGEIEIYIALK